MSKDTGLICEIVNDEIVIRIGIDTLKFAAEHLEEFYDGNSLANPAGPYIKIKDASVFATDIKNRLNREEEDGATPINSMFDVIIQDMFDYGSEGVDYDFVQPTDQCRRSLLCTWIE